jgi:hypothetical protein
MSLFEQRGGGDEQDMEEGEQAEEEEDEDSGSHKRARHHDEEVMEALPLRKRPKTGTETAPLPLAKDTRFNKGNFVLIMCDDDDAPFWCGRIVADPWWKGDDPYTTVHYYGPLTDKSGYKGVLVPSRRAGASGEEDYIEDLHCGCVHTEFTPTQTRQGIKIPQGVYNAYAEKQVVQRADLQSDDEESDDD